MSSKLAPVHVLILSKDPSLLSNQSGFGDTLQRHIYYAERLGEYAPGSDLRIVTLSRKGSFQKALAPAVNLKIYGTSSVHRVFYVLDSLRVLKQVFADGWKPTVITTQGPYEDGQLGLWLAKRKKARFIPQLHFDLFSQEWLRESRINPLRSRIARYVLGCADAVRVVSGEQKRKLVENMGLAAASIYIIPVGVSFKPTSNPKDVCKARVHPTLPGHKVVLFVGRLYAPKNMHLWIDVAEQVLRQEPETRFVVAGSGPLHDELLMRVRKSGLDQFIIFLGNVPYDNLPEVYGAADLFLLTSHYEGFGRVIVEANMAGVPVVSTNCAGPADIVVDGKTGFLCEPGDKNGLANIVLALLRDESKLEQFGKQAKKQVEETFGRLALANSLVRMWSFNASADI